MIKDRIKALQNRMVEENIDLYYFNTSDYHMSEYVPQYFKTIEYFSGFTGSLATFLVSKEKAYIFVDGRYHTQADNQCLQYDIEVIKLGTKDALEPIDFIIRNYGDAVVGFDGKRTSTLFGKQLTLYNIKIKSIDIYSELIENRVALSTSALYELDEKYTGKTIETKLAEIKDYLNGRTLIVNNLESIAYTLNLRADDILYTPTFLSYLIFDNNSVLLFINEYRLSSEIKNKLNNAGVITKPYDDYYDYLLTLNNKVILIDENKVNYETYARICDKGNAVINEKSIIEELKSVKNEVEQASTRLAHIYDGVSMFRFINWLKNEDKSKLDECDVADYLDNLRKANRAFDLSFSSIVAYDSNAAIVHYSPVKQTCAKLENKGILLVDSGGQYLEGTTDITRTISLGENSDEVKKYFTLVLKSMFSLSELKFVKGLAGNQIDIIARKDLWNEGVDYRHGTGHGVGHVLSVHEGPPNIRYMNTDAGTEKVSLKPGMVFSDEPGVYFEGKFGIRCENLLLCLKDYENEYGEFLKFETLTLVPFDLDLIDKKYLDDKTIKAINDYHLRVYETISPYLNDDEKIKLKEMTRAI